MLKPDLLEDIATKLDQLVPDDLKSMRRDFHANVKSILTAGLQKANLVTREEFEVQKAVLATTRSKLEALQKQLDALEAERG